MGPVDVNLIIFFMKTVESVWTQETRGNKKKRKHARLSRAQERGNLVTETDRMRLDSGI